jgi:AcrR family transcriptional regulator
MPRAQREQLILDVADQVFARDGYHPASMDEIARLAGISKPMLYAYFTSKEGLYLACIERSGQELVGRLQQAFDPAASPGVRLRARVDEFLGFVEEHRDGWRVLFSEASASRPVAREVAQLRARITSTLQHVLQAGDASGIELDSRTAEAVAHAIVGAGESLANWWLERPEVPREQLAEWYAAVIRGAVGARRGRPARPAAQSL